MIKLWKKFYLLLSLMMLLTNVSAGPIHTLILSRHAEKSELGGLSKQGIERAKRLAFMLQDIKIDAVYSTDYLRTKQTATPTTKQHQLAIELYSSNQNLIEDIQAILNDKQQAHTLLIIGHSNTIPQLIYALGGDALNDIDETDFSNLYLLQKQNNQTSLMQLHY